MTGQTIGEISLGDLAGRLGAELVGDAAAVVRGVNSLAAAGPDELAFLANARYERFMAGTAAAAVIVGADYRGAGRALLRCRDPYFAFREAMVMFHGFRSHPLAGIDELSRIDPAARVADGAAVGPFVTVAAGARVGEGTVLYPGVFVGPRCRVGRDCILYPNVVLYDDTVLGDRVTIHSGSVIGQDGFGYATHAGRHEKIPPAGWVEIGDDVELGAGCTIDRATLGPTVIGAGTKFSNLIAIGHGTRIGEHCLFVAQSGVAGSTTIGKYVAVGAQSGVVGHLNIGDGVRIAAQSGVANDVPAGMEVMGQPAMPRAQARRVYVLHTQLPKMRDQIKQLAAEVAELKARLAGGAGK